MSSQEEDQYEQHKAWEEEQERLASESAKAIADVDAKIEGEAEAEEAQKAFRKGLKDLLAKILPVAGTDEWFEDLTGQVLSYLVEDIKDRLCKVCLEGSEMPDCPLDEPCKFLQAVNGLLSD